MSYPLTRVLALLELLQTHPGLTGTQLADRLGTDVRTVRRYAARLRELGIPVESGRGRFGGYRLARGYRMPPLMLTNEEALVVMLGLLAGERLGMSATGPAGAGALAKIERVLPNALRDPLAAMRETVDFTANTVLAQAPQTGILLTLAQACRAGRTVGLHYRSWHQEDTERDVDPYGVIFHAGCWYLVGHDHLRDGLRTFRMDRIASATPCASTFTAPDDFDPVTYLTASLARTPSLWQVEVLIDGPLDDISRRLPRTIATLTATPTGVLLRAQVQRLESMAHLLASLEWPFTIRSPDQLRQSLKDLAQQLMTAAERPPEDDSILRREV